MPELLKDLIKTQIDPTIKSLGFVKRGSTYTKIENGFSKLIVVQSSQWNSFETLSFTIECGIFFPDLYSRCFNELPQYPKIEHCLWQYRKRIGYLKGTVDTWYELKQGEDNQAILASAKNDLTWYIRRYFDQYPTLYSFFAPSKT